MDEMNTYHIYLKDRCLFKNLDEDEFRVIWGRLYHSYWDDITFSVVEETKDQSDLEHSYQTMLQLITIISIIVIASALIVLKVYNPH